MRRVSVVVPTFNEPSLKTILDQLEDTLAPLDGEVVIVDDSATPPGEAEMPRAIPVRLLRGERRGKGDAVRLGMLAADGEVILHLDADIDEDTLPLIADFVRRIEAGADVVMAERRGRWYYRNFGRFVLSIGLFLAQRLFVFQSSRFFDTQCGFKAFRREVARKIASLQTVRGGMYDIEYLYIAVKNGLRIEQVSIGAMRELRPSRLRVLRCLYTDPIDLMRVKWNGLRGRYTR